MVDEKLKEYIVSNIKKGHNKEKIRHVLINSGYSPDTVELHFKSLENEKQKNSGSAHYWLVLLLVLLVSSLAVNFFLYSRGTLYPMETAAQKYDRLVSKADSLCVEGNYENAMSNLNQAAGLRDMEKRPTVYGVMGKCYMLQNRSEESIVAYLTAISKNSREPRYFLGLGTSYCRLGSYNIGITNLLKSVDLNPNDPEVYMVIKSCYLRAGNPEEAAKYAELAKKIGAKNINNSA